MPTSRLSTNQRSIEFNASLPHELMRILQSCNRRPILHLIRGKLCNRATQKSSKVKFWETPMNKFSCLSEFSVDSLKMDSMILGGINVLKCDIQVPNLVRWDASYQLCNSSSQVWTTLLPLGLNCLFGSCLLSDTFCVILGFSAPNISAIAKFAWQVSDSHTWEMGKLFTLKKLSKFSPQNKHSECEFCQSGSASSPSFSVQLTFNDPRLMYRNIYQGKLNRLQLKGNGKIGMAPQNILDKL